MMQTYDWKSPTRIAGMALLSLILGVSGCTEGESNPPEKANAANARIENTASEFGKNPPNSRRGIQPGGADYADKPGDRPRGR
jgi:hypothetical protein